MSRSLLFAACSLITALAIAPARALATAASVSYSTWIVSGSSVILRYRMSAAAAGRLAGAGVPVPTASNLGQYVLGHTGVEAEGRECPAIDQGYDLGKVDPLAVGNGLYGFEIVFQCAAPLARDVKLEDRAVFARAADHVDFARIQIGGRSIDQLFTSGREQLAIASLDTAAPAGIARYAALGIVHLLDSPDRLAFLIGTLLLVSRRRELAAVVLALACGYTLSIGVDAIGVLTPQMTRIEAFIGGLVALPAAMLALRAQGGARTVSLGAPALFGLVALGALAMHARASALLVAGAALALAGTLSSYARSMSQAGEERQGVQTRGWLLAVVVLGFLDGFVLPALVAPLDLPARGRALMAAAYDLGAVGAESVIVAAAALVLTLVRRETPIGSNRLWSDLAAAGLGGVGAFWFVSRLYS